MDNTPIIEVENVWKRYGLPPFFPWKGVNVDESDYALRGVSFTVPRGGSLGVLGRNGSGKSTLLKMLAGVTPADKGTITIRGSIFSMIELTAGMSMELTGKENIQILGIVMGLSNKEIEDISPLVEDFSELGDWLSKPVWQYSSGMLSRLAFGIAVYMKADILLVDEVLSTGDILFQKKCQLRIQQLLSGGTTLVFVSHSPYQVERLCDQAILLEAGSIVASGVSHSVMQEYLDRTVGRAARVAQKNNCSSNSMCLPPEHRPGTGDFRFTGGRLESDSHLSDNHVNTGETVRFVLEYEAKCDIENYNFNITITNSQGSVVALLGILPEEKIALIPAGGGEISCSIEGFPLVGEFFASPVMKTTYLLDRAENLFWFSAFVKEKEMLRSNGVGDVYMKPVWNFFAKKKKTCLTQNFDVAGLDDQEVKVFHYRDQNGDFHYEMYKEIQIAANLRKLDLTSVDSKDIAMLSSWLKNNVFPLNTGICHGTRNGKEQALFREYTGADVIGTDISPTAEQFPHTIQHDFHEIKPEWLNHFDFLFSNAYDHSYNLEYCIRQWLSSIRPGGVCILEHTRGHTMPKETDPIGVSRDALCQLVTHWGAGEFRILTILNGVDKTDGSDADFVSESQCFIVVQKQ